MDGYVSAVYFKYIVCTNERYTAAEAALGFHTTTFQTDVYVRRSCVNQKKKESVYAYTLHPKLA